MHKALFIFSGLQHMMTLTTDKTWKYLTR
jgi:hypothetical protein